ncbi:MAG: hypothetical protein VX278_11300 [Myxococcota bacterium]|nr:hypothetical protein [Myxococcota bacterium]
MNMILPASLFLLNCTLSASEEEEQRENWFYACQKYEKGTDAFGFCLYKNSETMMSIPDVQAYCAYAGKWQSQCIYNWVVTKIAPDSGYATEELLQLCGDIKDCAFRVVDLRPQDDVLEQLRLCKSYVRRNVKDCSMHAMVNWWKQQPDAADVARLMQVSSEPLEEYGYYLAVRIHCDGVGTCAGSPVMNQRCEELGKGFASEKLRCPQMRRGRDGLYKIPGGTKEDRKRHVTDGKPYRSICTLNG